MYQMTSITREQVYEIADELLRQGIKPTQQNVRDRLGSGSLTTINKALNEWWSGLGQRLDAQASGYDLPEPVIKLASKIWTDAIAYANRASESKHKEADEERKKLTEELSTIDSKYTQQIVDLNTIISERNNEISKLKMELNQAVTNLGNERDQSYRAAKALMDAETKLKQSEAGVHNNEGLLEAQVRLKIQAEEIARLNAEVLRLSTENAQLKLK
ncbi:DNA-binding protein [Marinobacterium sp. xm-d-579]|uniref:DNA-binding protein n=1 Tax=Marinobacterium sp. xm-d-579 TaxID=2497734 RepID=UPI001567D023|nr:DNA-binding protein [Marinobacterium sp. xm-d-579]